MKWIFGHGRPKRMANGTLAMEGQKEIVNDEANGRPSRQPTVGPNVG